MTPLQSLLEILLLQQIDSNTFQGRAEDLGWGRLFGGQVIAQAISAATQTTPENRSLHSLHSYFLRPGNVSDPVIYTVDRTRDGRSFTTRRVVATQNNTPIFHLAASYQTQEAGFCHQNDMPQTCTPESLISEQELSKSFLARLDPELLKIIPEKLRARAVSPRAIEIRPVQPVHPISPTRQPPHRQVWIRTTSSLPDDPGIHRILLAYASDFHFLATSMQPHGVSWMTPGMQVASLDHAMWFHRPVRVDQWLLYDVISPSASGARGLVLGHYFTTNGDLVATVMQEGLIRNHRDPTRSPVTRKPQQ